MNRVLAFVGAMALPIAFLLVGPNVGWTITTILFILWGTNVLLVTTLTRQLRFELSCPGDLVHELMMNDERGIELTNTILRGEDPKAQWQALEEFGERCIALGAQANQARYSARGIYQ